MAVSEERVPRVCSIVLKSRTAARAAHLRALLWTFRRVQVSALERSRKERSNDASFVVIGQELIENKQRRISLAADPVIDKTHRTLHIFTDTVLIHS